jgi:hypothetical protein
MAFNNRSFLGSKNLLVELKISNTDTINSILPKVETSSTVYYGGSKYPVTQDSYRIIKDEDGDNLYLYITLRGLGDISSGNSIFNGQRVYLNQKTEIRSDYQVQGYVADFYYDN